MMIDKKNARKIEEIKNQLDLDIIRIHREFKNNSCVNNYPIITELPPLFDAVSPMADMLELRKIYNKIESGDQTSYAPRFGVENLNHPINPRVKNHPLPISGYDETFFNRKCFMQLKTFRNLRL